MISQIKYYLVVAIVAVSMAGCNKDDVIFGQSGMLPVIEPENPYGVYTVKTGNELTISPTFEHVQHAEDIVWSIDGVSVANGFTWTATWGETGVYYVSVTALNDFGATTEELRVDVIEKEPPVISLNVPQGGFAVQVGCDFLIEPYVSVDEDAGALTFKWTVNGIQCAETQAYVFNADIAGLYKVSVSAKNDDGETVLEFDIIVTDGPPYSVAFPTQSFCMQETTRYTFPGRPLCLMPLAVNYLYPEFRWSVDGAEVACASRMFIFTPEHSGSYIVEVTVSEPGDEASKRTASVCVVCVGANEKTRLRPKTGASSARSDRVYEYIPAPGQFVGETADCATQETAAIWAEKTLAAGSVVSLGSFGGYITVGFDHSICRLETGFDFAVGANAFVNADGTGSNEPGIVWVMQDVNGNGLPDDEWYELKGSDYDSPGYCRDFAVTYFRPSVPYMNVEWEDASGRRGSVDYMPDFHEQPYYYPSWITQSSYTLRGSRISERNALNEVGGEWINSPSDWGYADNVGADNLGPAAITGIYQANGFSLDNAVMADGSSIELEYIDFVKVQTGVLAKSGILGEVSTEVCGFIDCSMGR